MKILKFENIESTQLYAKNFIKNNNVESDTLIIAETQSNGLGRLNRKWFSPENSGIYFSLITKKKSIFPYPFSVSVAVSRFFKKNFDLNIMLKWPNDLFYKEKKIGGILIDSIFNGNDLENIIIGIGINTGILQNIPDELKHLIATLDIKIEDKQKLIVSLCKFILDYFNNNNLLSEYIQKSYLINKNVKLINSSDFSFSGEVKGFTENGEIIISNGIETKNFWTCKKISFNLV